MWTLARGRFVSGSPSGQDVWLSTLPNGLLRGDVLVMDSGDTKLPLRLRGTIEDGIRSTRFVISPWPLPGTDHFFCSTRVPAGSTKCAAKWTMTKSLPQASIGTASTVLVAKYRRVADLPDEGPATACFQPSSVKGLAAGRLVCPGSYLNLYDHNVSTELYIGGVHSAAPETQCYRTSATTDYIHRPASPTRQTSGLETTPHPSNLASQFIRDAYYGNNGERVRTLLLLGAPGSGKTYALKSAEQECGVPCLWVTPHQLFQDEDTSAIAGPLVAIFARAKSYGKAVIFFDDLDLLIPVASPDTEANEVAHLRSEFNAEMKAIEDGSAIVVIATAQQASSVGVVGGGFGSVRNIPPPSPQERSLFCSNLLHQLGLSVTEERVSDVFRITSGYCPADYGFVRTTAEIAFDSSGDRSINHLRSVISECPPAMISYCTWWKPVARPQSRTPPLRGLDEPTRELRLAIRSMFTLSPVLRSFSMKPARGVALTGPSGSGKSAILRSVLPQLTNFPVVLADSSELISSVVGVAESSIKQLFAYARAASPCVVVFDEIDVLAPARNSTSGTSNESMSATHRRIVGTLLVELDGLVEDSTQLFVVATARDLNKVDPALLRPGRLERTIHCKFPDQEARRQILKDNLERLGPFDETTWEWLSATITEGLSAAEIIGRCHRFVIDSVGQSARPTTRRDQVSTAELREMFQ